MNKIKKALVALVATVLFATSATVAWAETTSEEQASNQQIAKKVRHELVTLPYYGVFDNLAYKVDASTVTLYGQVLRPSTRSDAKRRVERIKGVTRVVNNIEVLPLSSFDDSIRVRTFRVLFGKGSLYRYALGANPSIHIIVNRGHVTLEGVVANKLDKQLAFFAANEVSDVFSVTNNLRIENEGVRY